MVEQEGQLYMGTPEALQWLRDHGVTIHINTYHKYVRSGAIKATRFVSNGRWRTTKDWLQNFVDRSVANK
jgi:predicted site-specific integrase-resolvase